MVGHYIVKEVDTSSLKVINQSGDISNYKLGSPWFEFLRYIEQFDSVFIDKKDLSNPNYLGETDLLVINPYYLVSVTYAVDAIVCPRKVYVRNMGAGQIDEDPNLIKRMTQGNLLHSLFSNMVTNNESVENNIENVLQLNKSDIITSNMTIQAAKDYLINTGSVLKAFSLDGVSEIDTQNWNYGLHGKFDAMTSSNKIIELKSSKIPYATPWPSHNLQMNTYIDIMEDKEKYSGMVLYLNDGQMGMKKPTPWDFQKTIVARNWSYLILIGKYQPPVLRQEKRKNCRNCFLKSGCLQLCSGLNQQRDCEECYHDPLCDKSQFNSRMVEYYSNFIKSTLVEELEIKQEEHITVTLKNQAMDSRSLIYSKDTLIGQLDTIISNDFEKFQILYTHNSKSNKFRTGDFVSIYPIEKRSNVNTFFNAIISEITNKAVKLQTVNRLPDKVIITHSNISSLQRRSRSALFHSIQSDSNLIRFILNLNHDLVNDDPIPQITKLSRPIRNYNNYQMSAILNSINTPDLFLIQGPAGTGKSSVIVEIVNQLFQQSKLILVSAYTNKAVDHIGKILLLSKIPFLRIGSKYSVSKELEKNLLENNPEKFQKLTLKTGPIVVLSTTSSIGNQKYSNLYFDFVLLDETAQITEPNTLIPLLLSNKAILVGDHAQLEPIIISNKAKDLGLQVSLFERLYNKLPNRRILLQEQYRMNDEILSLPNKLFYNNLLKSASQRIGTQALSLKDPKNSLLINEIPYQIVILKDLDLNNPQINILESHLIIETLLELFSNFENLTPQDLGIITPFRAQVAYLRNLLPGFDIDTIDRFQGSEKDIIIFATTSAHDVPILMNPRRINVALTRAKKKLIVILTNPDTNQSKGFLGLIYEDGKKRDLITELTTSKINDLQNKDYLFKLLISMVDILKPFNFHLSQSNKSLLFTSEGKQPFLSTIYYNSNKLEIVNNSDNVLCILCWTPMNECVICKGCDTKFHILHLQKWITKNNNCPACKHTLVVK